MDAIEELVRLKVRELRRELPNQAAVIAELNSLGFEHDRIAELLGTTSDTVRSSLTKAKARAKAASTNSTRKT